MNDSAVDSQDDAMGDVAVTDFPDDISSERIQKKESSREFILQSQHIFLGASPSPRKITLSLFKAPVF